MNPIHFFTLGYYQEYLIFGIIFGVIIGVYAYFRVKYALNNVKLSKNKKLAIKVLRKKKLDVNIQTDLFKHPILIAQ